MTKYKNSFLFKLCAKWIIWKKTSSKTQQSLPSFISSSIKMMTYYLYLYVYNEKDELITFQKIDLNLLIPVYFQTYCGKNTTSISTQEFNEDNKTINSTHFFI